MSIQGAGIHYGFLEQTREGEISRNVVLNINNGPYDIPLWAMK